MAASTLMHVTHVQEGTLTTTGTYSYAVGSTRYSRELLIFSREHMCRRERSLQQGAIHIQEGVLTTAGSYSCAGGNAQYNKQGAIHIQ